MTRATQARELWAKVATDAEESTALRAATAWPEGPDLLDALWWLAHPLLPTPAGRPDPALELAELEGFVYSKAGSQESAVDVVDAATGETVRATPSEFRLRTLRAARFEQAAVLDEVLARFADVDDEPGRIDSDAASAPSTVETAPDHPRSARRQRPIVLLAVTGAFVLGVVTASMATSVQSGIGEPATPSATPHFPVAGPPASDDTILLVFDRPTNFPDIPVPDLGDGYVPDSLRNISGTSPAEDGFAVFVGRSAEGGLYCLIVSDNSGSSGAGCAPADIVAQQGLWIRTQVTVLSPVTYSSPLGTTEMAATLTNHGDFFLSFPPFASP